MPDDFLQDLASGMHQPDGELDDNEAIPAGYTYFGQFVDHDITFDPVSSLQRINDPDALENFRTPRFDLDSVYGSGPGDEPFQYDRDSIDGVKLLVGKGRDVNTGETTSEDDLPRNAQGIALIGDPRNDENIIVSQLQLAFIKLHNKFVDQISGSTGLTGGELFKEAQRLTRWHYQWIVVHDFLDRTVGPDIVGQILRADQHGVSRVENRFYRPKVAPYMPVEFSVAAYRFGHSQVRPSYFINERGVPELPIFSQAEDPGELEDFHGRRFLPKDWTISWSFFFPIPGANPPQLSQKIDTKLAAGLFKLPGEPAERESLPLRNLQRGRALSLPSGRRVAHALGLPEEQKLNASDLGFSDPAPLWYYILREADVKSGGQRLGPVGGRIVAEVLLGLLAGDPLSWINVSPDWQPEIPDADGDGKITLADLLKFAVPDQTTGPTPPSGGWTPNV